MKIRKNDYISNTNVIEAAKRERYTFSQIQSSVLSLLQEPNSTFEVIVTSIYSNSPYNLNLLEKIVGRIMKLLQPFVYVNLDRCLFVKTIYMNV